MSAQTELECLMTTATTRSPEETAQLHRLFDLGMRKVRFWQENYERFLPEYDGQFVACDIDSGKVVGSDSSLFALIDALDDRKIDRDHVATEYISANPPGCFH